MISHPQIIYHLTHNEVPLLGAYLIPLLVVLSFLFFVPQLLYVEHHELPILLKIKLRPIGRRSSPHLYRQVLPLSFLALRLLVYIIEINRISLG